MRSKGKLFSNFLKSEKFSFVCSFGTVFFSFIGTASAEICSFRGDFNEPFIADVIIGEKSVPLEMAFEDYQYMLFDACAAIGLPYDDVCTTYPLMGEIHFNAMATTCSGVPKIIYDRRLSPKIGYAGAQAVIAHELGHIMCGHLNGKNNAYHAAELEADRFAGAVMRRMGYAKEMTLNYLPIISEQVSFSHPGRSDRKTALIEGWENPEYTNVCTDF